MNGICKIGVALAVLVVYGNVPSAVSAPGSDSAAITDSMLDVIVIMRDQVTDTPPTRGGMEARKAAVAAMQAPVLAQAQAMGAARIRSFRMINAFAASISRAQMESLSANRSVKAVVVDRVIHVTPRAPRVLGGGFGIASRAVPKADTDADGLCNTLEPQALQLTNTAFADPTIPQAQQVRDGNGRRVTGEGVKVAYLADSVDPNILGFARPDGTHVFFDYQDFSGDPAGTPTTAGEGFGDASAIAAQDLPNGQPLLFDISRFVSPAHPLPSPCNIRIRGMAPGVSLAGLKFFSTQGLGTTSATVQAIEWAVIEDQVDVINESFTDHDIPDDDNDPVSLANAAAIRAGVTVVVASGDGGSTGTIQPPASDSGVISVGASTDFRIYAQLGELPGNAGYLDNNIATFSSGGVTLTRGRTVDVVAPGDAGWSLCSTDTALYQSCFNFNGNPSPLKLFSGTSQSAPLTAGVAALIIQAYRSSHGGVSPAPALVKRIIMSTATDLGAPSSEQGAGLVNSLAAVHAALSIEDENGRPASRQGRGVLIAPGSVSIADLPDTPETRSFILTNTGATTAHFTPTLQRLDNPIAGATVSLTLDPANDPTFPSATGVPLPFVKETFEVPSGAQYLPVALAYKSPLGSTAIVFLILLDPSGREAAFAAPQGGPDGGNVRADVVMPMAGTWTAMIVTAPAGSPSSYTGTMTFTWSASQYTIFGTVTPSHLELPPGQHAQITARFNMPSDPGDTSTALRLSPRTPGGLAASQVPLTLRTLIPVGSRGGHFSGSLTGGNGRPGAEPKQIFAFDIPPHADALSLGLHWSDTGSFVEGMLVDPQGMELSVQTNLDLAGMLQPALQMFRRDPQPGRWHFVLLQYYTSSGMRTSVPFSGSIQILGREHMVVGGLPNDPAIQLSASAGPTTYPVQVTNPGVATVAYFVDARLDTLKLIPLPNTVECPVHTIPGACAEVLVPPETRLVKFLGRSSAPLDMEVVADTGFGLGFNGSPDLFARPVGTDVVEAALAVPEVPYGTWQLRPTPVAPFGPAGAPPASFTDSAFALTQPFDSAVSSNTGNIWIDQMQGTHSFKPLVLGPAQTGTVAVTLTPDPAQVGKTISGFVYIDTYSESVMTGDEVDRIPYAYTVAP